MRRAYLRLVVIVHQEDVVHPARALQRLEVEPAAHAARALARRDRPLHRRLEHREDQLEPVGRGEREGEAVLDLAPELGAQDARAGQHVLGRQAQPDPLRLREQPLAARLALAWSGFGLGLGLGLDLGLGLELGLGLGLGFGSGWGWARTDGEERDHVSRGELALILRLDDLVRMPGQGEGSPQGQA